MVVCKANSVYSLDKTVARVAFQITLDLVDGLLRVHVESVTLFKCGKPSTPIVSAPVSVLQMRCSEKELTY